MGFEISFGRTPVVVNREHKGKNIIELIEDYVVIDLETTGLDPNYDAIIEFAAVRVKRGEIVSTFQSLANPSFRINAFITELTGITNEMLSNAPTIKSVLPHFLEFVGDSIIIAHNANFDINFLYDNSPSQQPFKNDFIDTMRLSRRLFKEERHHRLVDLIDRFNISDKVEHRALSDALKTQKCYEYMKSHMYDNNISLNSLYPQQKAIKASETTTTNVEFDKTTLVYGKIFVFTGTLQLMTRKDAMQLVVDMGGIPGDGVTLKTNYLVLGNNDYCPTIKDGKSLKQKKAERYKADGLDIEVISENVFYEMIEDIKNENKD